MASREIPGWEDFEPQTEREELAYSLLVAGVCIDDPAGGPGVLLDFDLADMVLEDLHHRRRAIVALLDLEART